MDLIGQGTKRAGGTALEMLALRGKAGQRSYGPARLSVKCFHLTITMVELSVFMFHSDMKGLSYSTVGKTVLHKISISKSIEEMLCCPAFFSHGELEAYSWFNYCQPMTPWLNPLDH